MSAKGREDKKRKRGNVSQQTGVKSNGKPTKFQERFENAVEVYKLYVEQFSSIYVPNAFEIDDTFGSKIEEAGLDVPNRMFGHVVRAWAGLFTNSKRRKNPGNLKLLLDAGYNARKKGSHE
eukprot:COSAG06_NODE_810_length_12163_cov_34.318137_6_plen_121_part_00